MVKGRWTGHRGRPRVLTGQARGRDRWSQARYGMTDWVRPLSPRPIRPGRERRNPAEERLETRFRRDFPQPGYLEAPDATTRFLGQGWGWARLFAFQSAKRPGRSQKRETPRGASRGRPSVSAAGQGRLGASGAEEPDLASLAFLAQPNLGLHHAFHRVGQTAFPADELFQLGVGCSGLRADRIDQLGRVRADHEPSGRRSFPALAFVCLRGFDLTFRLAFESCRMSKGSFPLGGSLTHGSPGLSQQGEFMPSV